MLKYSQIINQTTGLCAIATGDNVEYYQSIGMVERDVEQSDIDGNWYLAELCPHKTDEEKLREAKEAKYQEANTKANLFLNTQALYELNPTFHVEATKENMNTLSSAAIAIEKGYIEFQVWTSKEDNVLNLTAEQCMQIAFGIGAIQGDVWCRQFISYKNAIEHASTIEEVEMIIINYGE